MTFDFPDDAQIHVIVSPAGSHAPPNLPPGAALLFPAPAARTRSAFRPLLTGVVAVAALFAAFKLGGYVDPSSASRATSNAALAAAQQPRASFPQDFGTEANDALQETLDATRAPPRPYLPPSQREVPSAFRQQLAARPQITLPSGQPAVPSGVGALAPAPAAPAAAAPAPAPAGANPFGLHE